MQYSFLTASLFALFSYKHTLCGANVITDFCSGAYTPTDWVNEFIASSSSLSAINIVYTGDCSASGKIDYTDPVLNFVESQLGPTVLALTSGSLGHAAIDMNTATSITQSNGVAGDGNLDILNAPLVTYDASVIEFDVKSEEDILISFNYMFASDEYPEYVGSSYNDVFGFFVNGVNVAEISSGGITTRVSINTLNIGSFPGLYVDNQFGTFNTEYDGLSVVLTTMPFVIPGGGQLTHIKLAIGDATDFIYDSAVFFKTESFSQDGPCFECAQKCETLNSKGACYGEECLKNCKLCSNEIDPDQPIHEMECPCFDDDSMGCYECADGFFKVSFDYPCQECDPNCLQCGDFFGCNKCAEGYVLVFDPTCGDESEFDFVNDIKVHYCIPETGEPEC